MGCPFVLIRLPCGVHTLIDAADLEKVQAHYWNAAWGSKFTYYVVGRVDGLGISLHRWLVNPAAGLVVDHINGDGLDNRRSVNLRPATRSENGTNRVRTPSPLSLGWLPRSVPIVSLAKAPTPRGYSRARFEAAA